MKGDPLLMELLDFLKIQELLCDISLFSNFGSYFEKAHTQLRPRRSPEASVLPDRLLRGSPDLPPPSPRRACALCPPEALAVGPLPRPLFPQQLASPSDPSGLGLERPFLQRPLTSVRNLAQVA